LDLGLGVTQDPNSIYSSFLLFAHRICFKKQIRLGHIVKFRFLSAVPKWYDEPWKGRTAHEPYFWLNNVYLCDIFQKNILATGIELYFCELGFFLQWLRQEYFLFADGLIKTYRQIIEKSFTVHCNARKYCRGVGRPINIGHRCTKIISQNSIPWNQNKKGCWIVFEFSVIWWPCYLIRWSQILTVQSDEHDMKIFLKYGFHLTVYTGAAWASKTVWRVLV